MDVDSRSFAASCSCEESLQGRYGCYDHASPPKHRDLSSAGPLKGVLCGGTVCGESVTDF